MTGATVDPPATIAFVGLGRMGSPMARHLAAAGYRLVVHDASPAAVEAHLAASPGARAARSAAEAAEGAQVFVTMLPDGEAVRQVVHGDGVAAALGRGGVVVDMSSSAPLGTQRLGAELAPLGIGVLDAPVSGGVRRAVDRTLAIMVGGDPALVRRCRPVLAAMGGTLHLTGPLGSGHAMKALNNFVSAAALAATCEALLVGRRFGLDPALMVDVLNASSGRNNTTEVKAKQYLLSGTFGSGFSLALMAKDLRTAAELADALELPAPVAHETSALWARALRELPPGADHTEIYRWLERLGAGGTPR